MVTKAKATTRTKAKKAGNLKTKRTPRKKVATLVKRLLVSQKAVQHVAGKWHVDPKLTATCCRPENVERGGTCCVNRKPGL